MTDFLASILFWLIMAIIFSVLWDLYTYTDRQDKWERDHPGATYIPGYKKTLAKSERMKRKNGVL